MTFIQPRTLDVLAYPFFVATEGMGDATFVDKLLQHKNIGNYGVGCPSRDSARGTGKNAFPDYFLALQTARKRAKSVPLRGLLVVADANGDAAGSFQAVATALQNSQFPRPEEAYKVTDDHGFRVAVYLMPGEGETGTLEHLLLKAVFKKSTALEKCLDAFSACTGGLKSNKPNVHAKMRMSALAAAFCEDNPWCSSNTMWSDEKNPVPIDSDVFDPLSQMLTDFSN